MSIAIQGERGSEVSVGWSGVPDFRAAVISGSWVAKKAGMAGAGQAGAGTGRAR